MNLSKEALYPVKEEEFKSILLPLEWKEMEPLKENTKSYQYVKWGTRIVLVLLSVLLWIVLMTDWLGTSFFSFAYLFFIILSAIKHPGNLFILSEGIVLDGRYYPSKQIKYYETEKIIRWHELYGLDSQVNNAYKLTFKLKNKLFGSDFVVVKDETHLEQILALLEKQGISGIRKGEVV